MLSTGKTVARILSAAAVASFSAGLVLKLKYVTIGEIRSAVAKDESDASASILRKKRFATIAFLYDRSDIGSTEGTRIVLSLVLTVTSL